MKAIRPDRGLERLLLALEPELLSATDQEILAAAAQLGMNPTMQGSSAWFGVTFALQRRTAEADPPPQPRERADGVTPIRARRNHRSDDSSS
ncbi:MAG: hypothetical protein ACYCT1_03260 [Steroidobacteraceae bacterium]